MFLVPGSAFLVPEFQVAEFQVAEFGVRGFRVRASALARPRSLGCPGTRTQNAEPRTEREHEAGTWNPER